MQKHAYEALTDSQYSVNTAVEGELHGKFINQIDVYGTPPTTLVVY